MAIKHYAGLDTNYLPTDGSVPVALGSEAVELIVASGRVSQAVSLEGYDKIAFVTEGDTNTSIDFLEILGNESTDATLEIVKDINASSGYALKMTGIQKLVFGTRISYVPDILKKITLKAKKDSGNTGNLYASVVSYANGQYINKLGNISVEDYVSVVDTSSLTDSYTTNIGYIKGVGTSFVEPASNPNSPSELPSSTDEIALILESTGASDIYYIDVISLEEVENTIRDIPDGQGVYDSSQNFNTRNDRITTTPANPVVTTPSTCTLNGDGSVDITFTWTHTGSGDAYNIDGFGIYVNSSDTSTPPTFTDSAVYVDMNTREYTLYGVTINKYYTVGVQAYRSIDHDVALDLTLSEDVLRSAIVQTTPYRPANITPSTTSYAIQRNVSSYLGSEVLGSIYVHGYYPNSMRGDISGQILYNEGSSDTDMYLAINAQAVDCTDFTYTADTEFTCYLVLNGGVVKPAIYDINTNTFKNDTETVSSGVVIGYVIVDYVHSETVYTIQDAYVYENAKLLSMSKTTKLEEAWKYLSEATDQTDWENRVDDLGIENSFTFLAAYNAFIVNLFSEDIELGGQIRANYTPDGDVINPEDAGFWLSAKSGILRAQFAELVGTLRTGRNAPTDARVAIQDESGITSGPTFTGSGLNDMYITKAGGVAGDFRVKISGINNATNSGKQESWVPPFQVGTNNWRAIAVNSSGRFVAVGDSGYVSYSNDGITWATPFQVGTNNWRAIAVNSSGRFVAVGYNSYIAYSNDGITWATPFQVGTYYWDAIAVNSSGRFVAVGGHGYVSYSNDGITWATPFQVGTFSWYAIAVNSSGKFVAGGDSSYIAYSNDGITWATPFRVGTVGTDTYWYGIAVNSSGRFVAVGGRAIGGSSNVSYSDDGITWATPFQVGTYYWYGIAVNSSGKFVAVGGSGYISYSDDGITWATPFRVGTVYWQAIAVNSSGKFVAGGSSGYITMSLLQDTIQISSNGGTTWGSDIPIPSGEAISITGFGVDISFSHFSGHTVGNYWSFTQGAMRGLAITDSGGDEYLSASNGEVTLKKLNATTVDATTVNATTVYGARFN